MVLIESAPAVLIVHVHNRAYALPLAQVVEIMRLLPLEPIAGAPAYLLGLAIIRGLPTPVIDLAALLGDPTAGDCAMLVLTRAAGRPLALAVGRVEGVSARASTEAGPTAGPRAVGVLADDGARRLLLSVDLDLDVAPHVWGPP